MALPPKWYQVRARHGGNNVMRRSDTRSSWSVFSPPSDRSYTVMIWVLSLKSLPHSPSTASSSQRVMRPVPWCPCSRVVLSSALDWEGRWETTLVDDGQFLPVHSSSVLEALSRLVRKLSRTCTLDVRSLGSVLVSLVSQTLLFTSVLNVANCWIKSYDHPRLPG
jgi:hypothetical protein